MSWMVCSTPSSTTTTVTPRPVTLRSHTPVTLMSLPGLRRLFCRRDRVTNYLKVLGAQQHTAQPADIQVIASSPFSLLAAIKEPDRGCGPIGLDGDGAKDGQVRTMHSLGVQESPAAFMGNKDDMVARIKVGKYIMPHAVYCIIIT